MSKRILPIVLVLLFLLCAAPVMAVEADFSLDELLAALAADELQLAYADLGGIYVDMADGQTQKFLHSGKKLYVDPSVETAEGYVWVWFYHATPTPATSLMDVGFQVEYTIQGGAVRASDLTSAPPQASAAGRPSYTPPPPPPPPESPCFIAGTPIQTDKGLIEIQDIRPADQVYAADIETGEQGLQTVLRTFVHEADELVHVSIEGECICTTRQHPFYVEGKGWIFAGELSAGDQLVLFSGKRAQVIGVEVEKLEAPTFVYNMEVAGFHTYFVGEAGVLVHNK